MPENIGMVARAMLNFGLPELRLGNPRCLWPSERATDSSAGAGRVLESARLYRSLAEAIADCQSVYAASVRPRDLVKRVVTPRQAVAQLRDFLGEFLDESRPAVRRAAIVFGPERTGLINDDIALVEAVITVPVNPEFSSLNLAQAVVVLAYEWFIAHDATPASQLRHGNSTPAEHRHLQSFLGRLEHELDLCGFLR
ncbi:MAG: RNA methyltransferase, partial [Alphaproteobacteria bacterium]|nr:RNA methyltransferase [Alphaproteobacteria bacterium]